MTKKIYKVFNKKDKETVAWLTDSEDLFYLLEWYGESDVDYGVEVYKLIDKW